MTVNMFLTYVAMILLQFMSVLIVSYVIKSKIRTHKEFTFNLVHSNGHPVQISSPRDTNRDKSEINKINRFKSEPTCLEHRFWGCGVCPVDLHWIHTPGLWVAGFWIWVCLDRARVRDPPSLLALASSAWDGERTRPDRLLLRSSGTFCRLFCPANL